MMESIDNLISSLYQAAAEDDWRSFRQRGLAQVCETLGATAAAWWTHGTAIGLDRGYLTQTPAGQVTAENLASLPFPALTESPEAVIELPSSTGRSVGIRYAHRSGALLSTLLLSFAAGKKLPTMEAIKRVAGHLADAGALCLRQFIRRDDWLHSMGRTSRGAAALVDADGAVHAASDRFIKLIGGDEAKSVSQLPFELPEDVQGDEGGEFISGSLHVRVSREAPLYLVYARQPLPLDALSPREQEIARAIGDGKTLKSIARQYGIAVSTVANHTTRIYRKLAIYRREDLIELVRMRPESARKNG